MSKRGHILRLENYRWMGSRAFVSNYQEIINGLKKPKSIQEYVLLVKIDQLTNDIKGLVLDTNLDGGHGALRYDVGKIYFFDLRCWWDTKIIL